MLNAPSTRFADLEGSHHLVSSRRPLQVFRSQLEDFLVTDPNRQMVFPFRNQVARTTKTRP